MPLSSRQILANLRGSETGKAPFLEYSLGDYLTKYFDLSKGKRSWMIECSNPAIISLVNRKLQLFRIGIYHNSLSNSILVEDNRSDQVIQGYTISVFKGMARKEGYDEEEEFVFYDMCDAIVNWQNTYLKPTVLSMDADGCPTILDFKYVSQSQIQRSEEQRYIYQEYNFQAIKQLEV